MKRVVLCTGGFDPLHSGHIAYFESAKKLGDILIVGVNSDAWLARKKGQAFMSEAERVSIISALSVVDDVLLFNDSDGTAKEAIRTCLDRYEGCEIIFANGGDRTNDNIPEMSVTCTLEESKRLKFVFGVGGENKMNSSSRILTEWKTPKTLRSWGYYRVLHTDGPSIKVKELVVEPRKSLSLQRHKLRSEHWMVSYGTAIVKRGYNINELTICNLPKGQEIDVHVNQWHQLINDTDEELRIVEIQHGVNCIEEDIERFDA